MSDYIHPLIADIARELPKPGEPMSAQRRANWMAVFEGILDLLYPELPVTTPAPAAAVRGIMGDTIERPKLEIEGADYGDAVR